MKRISSRTRLHSLGVLSAFLISFSAFAGGVDAFSRQYSDVEKQMAALANAHPANVKVVDVGLNDTGQTIRALKIGSGNVSNLIVGTHHGNEYGSTELALATMTSLAESPIKGQTVFVIPVLNVSGYNARIREELGNDPNRDYPGPCGTDGPFRLKSTKALADFIAREKIVTSATLHTHSGKVLYPWGFSTHDVKTEYDALYIELSKAAAMDSGYAVGNSALDLYPADGCYEDYAMATFGIWSLLFEVGSTHRPTQAQIDEIIRGNVPGLRRFLETAPRMRAEKHAFTGKCDTDKSGPRRIDE